MKFPDKNPKLSLYLLEERLISPGIPFMQIRELLRGGQLSIRGNIVNVVANVNSTIVNLPLTLSKSETVPIKLKRKIPYSSHAQFENIRPYEDLESLHYLVSKTELFKSQGECGIAPTRSKRIVGGQDAEKAKWPWIALLYNRKVNWWSCWGTLISTNWVVTSAKCFDYNDESLSTVYLGKPSIFVNESGINVEKLVVHPDYKRSINADIALIRLTEHVVFTEKIKPVCLPSVEKAEQLLQPGTNGTMLEWRRTGIKEYVLQE
uniref:Transmembrane protease serine 11D-like n=1 Tax=Saccoglossus kowalevskii TaxID=10224 RepID=A0ABM0MTW8_SACKO